MKKRKKVVTQGLILARRNTCLLRLENRWYYLY